MRGGRALNERLEGPLWLAAETDAAGLIEADLEGRSITLSREPFGGVPLYFAQADGLVLFSTHARALLSSGIVRGGLNHDAALEAALSGDLAVLFGTATLLSGIEEVLPGNALTFSTGGFTRRETPNPFVDNPGSRRAAGPAEARRDLLAATARAIGGDARVAVGLSGGVDSAGVAASAVGALGPGAVHAFTYDFVDGSRASEAPWAALVARRLGIVHRIVPVEYGAYVRALPELFWRLEAPRLSPGAWMSYAPALRESGFSRVLTGDGLEAAWGLPGPLDLSENIGRALAWLPKPSLTLRHWPARRFHGWPLRRLARLLDPGLEPPRPHEYHMLVCMLRANGLLDDVGPFYPAALRDLARASAGSPRVAEAAAADLNLPLAEQLRRRRMSSYFLHRLFRGKLSAFRELGAVPVAVPFFLENPSSRPAGGPSSGLVLRRLALDRDVPAEIFARPKVRNHSILPDAWAARITSALAPLASEAAERLVPPGPGRDELLRRFGRDLALLGLWLRIFDAGPVPDSPPTLESLGLEKLFSDLG